MPDYKDLEKEVDAQADVIWDVASQNSGNILLI